jgi:DNA polymerase-3 subunit alpha
MVSERDRRRVTPEHFFKPAAAMREAFADLPEACDNTLAIARMCAVMETSKKPELPICPKVQPGRTEAETVADMARTGLAKRFPDGVPPSTPSAGIRAGRHRADGLLRLLPHRRRLHPVGEGPGHRRRAGPRLGRGQRGGLGALHHRPRPAALRLLFERFLNPERVSMPDFDIDFCQERRDEVIAYVRREYGEDRVAQIITFGKLQAKAAVRDVGRVLGMAYGQVDRVASLIPNVPANPVNLTDAIAGEPRLQEMRDTDEAIHRLLEIALQVEGLYRNASTHAAGVVIGRRPLIEITPIYRDPRSTSLITQYSMKYVEQASLVKFDFLGLKTLTVLERAVISSGAGRAVDLAALPLDDAPTYEMLARAMRRGFSSSKARACGTACAP